MARISPVFGSITIAVPPVGPVPDDSLVQLAFHHVLEVLVDRELHAGTGRRRPLQPAERVMVRVGLDEQLALLTANLAVVRRLDSREPCVVESDEAEHLGGHLPVGVEALVLFQEADALQLQIGDPSWPARARSAGARTRRAAPATGASRASRGPWRCSRRAPAQQRRHLRGILDFIGHGIDRIALHAVREHAAVAIEDVAALGRDVARPARLAFGAALEIGMACRPGGRPAAPVCRRPTRRAGRPRPPAGAARSRASYRRRVRSLVLLPSRGHD